MPTLVEQLTLHEALRLVVYDDATGLPIAAGSTLQGHPTIGIGRNLAALGISETEAEMLLLNDIARVTRQLLERLPWFDTLDPIRQRVLVDMGFNMGVSGLLKFKNTLRAVQEGRYADAAAGMLASRWATQVKGRAVRLARMMETGEDYTP